MSLSERLEQAKANLQPSSVKVVMFSYENDRYLVGIRPVAESLEFTIGLVQQAIPNLANVHPRDIAFYATIPEFNEQAMITESSWQPLAPALEQIAIKVVSRPQVYRAPPAYGYATPYTTNYGSKFNKGVYDWQVTLVPRPPSEATVGED